jgi:hypothetical protein
LALHGKRETVFVRTRARRRFALGNALVVLVVAAVVAVLVVPRSSHAPASRPTAVLTVGGPMTAPAIPRDFLGFSTEYAAIEQYAGTDPHALDPVFLRLIRNLTHGQPTVIRIGGDSADRTWWPIPGVTQSPGINYSLNQRWVRVTRALSGALGARLILGINLEADSLSLASTEADHLVSGLGPATVAALELGNEPELYDSFAFYRVNDRAVTGRPRNRYSLRDFIDDFALFSSVMPHAAIAGPTIGGPGWLKHLTEFLDNESRVRLITVHRYPLQSCFAKPSSPAYPTVARLLAPASSTGLANGFRTVLAIARARGLPVRIDELNSVSCGADPSVSYTFASALWVIEAMFEMARTGVAGVNIHTFPGAGYELFKLRQTGGRWSASVAPEYYGLAMFQLAAPPGSQQLRVGVSGRSPVREWATKGLDGRTRVVMVDADPAHAAVVAVRVPGVRGAATLERLRGPGLSARGGASLGGQSFNGAAVLSGRRQVDAVSPAGGRYLVRLPAGSAALLTLGSSAVRSG